MLTLIISLLITIATFYLMAYFYKISYDAPKVTIGNVLDEYSLLVIGIIIPIINIIFFVIFTGAILFKISKDVRIL